MTEGDKPLSPAETQSELSHALWTPPEAIDENTRRMAWLLFLEEWKARGRHSIKETGEWAEITYADCLAAAKAVRAQEQQPTVSVKPADDDPTHMRMAQELEDEKPSE